MEAAIIGLRPYVIAISFLLLYAAEHLWPQRAELIDYRHDARNLGVGLLNAAIIFGLGYLLQKGMVAYNARGIGLLPMLATPGRVRWLAEGLLLDCAMYWWHRANHRWPLLWQFHCFHHADRKLNSTSALRFHTVELTLSYFWRVLLFPLLGISVAGFAGYNLVFTLLVLLHHSAIRMPAALDRVLRLLIVTPHIHRVHHSIVKTDADSNYGSVLSWWDWIFTSYHRPGDTPIEFGTNPDS